MAPRDALPKTSVSCEYKGTGTQVTSVAVGAGGALPKFAIQFEHLLHLEMASSKSPIIVINGHRLQ